MPREETAPTTGRRIATCRVFAAIAFCLLGGAASAVAASPYMIGDRWFPSTPLVDTPFVGDALYATIQHLRQPGSPNFGESNFEFGVEKRLTDDLGISVAETYDILTPLGQGSVHGFDNVYASVKYQAFESVAHEAMLSIGVTREFGGTGAGGVGAEPISLTTPAVFFTKGFGDLPDAAKFLRPVAVGGSFGYQVADARTHGDDHFPEMAEIGVSLQYSLPYLQGNVAYVGLPPAIGRLTPLVEFIYDTPTTAAFGEKPTGLVAPGIVYSERGLDLSLEALLPVNRQSGVGVGVVIKVRVPLDRIAAALGKPLFGD